MDVPPNQKPLVTPVVIEEALDHILPRLPSWASRHAQRRIGTARDPWGCALRACLHAYLQDTHDCSNLLSMYAEGIWIQGPTRPLQVTPPSWVTGADVLAQLRRQGLLVVHNGTQWGRGVLAAALLREDGDPGQDRLYLPERSQGKFAISWTWTIACATRPDFLQ